MKHGKNKTKRPSGSHNSHGRAQSHAPHWIENTLNSPKLFYGALGVLCICYISFAAVNHISSKKKAIAHSGPELKVDIPFNKKPKDGKPYTSEYGGLFYVRGEGDVEAKGDAASAKEADAESTKTEKSAAASSPEDKNKDADEGVNPDYADLIAGTVVKAAEGDLDMGGIAPQAFKPMSGFGSGNSGGSSGGGGGFNTSGGDTAASAESPDPLELSPVAGGPIALSQGAARRMTSVGAGSTSGSGGGRNTSGIVGSQPLTQGTAGPERTTSGTAMAETLESQITSGGAQATGAGAGADPQKEERKSKAASSGGSGVNGGAGGGGGGNNSPSSGTPVITDPVITDPIINDPVNPGNCSQKVPIMNAQGQIIEVCPNTGGPVDPYDPYNTGNTGNPNCNPYIDPLCSTTNNSGPASTTEFFKEKTPLRHITDAFWDIGDTFREGLGGIRAWWQEDVVPGNPFLKDIDDAFHSSVDWIDNTFNVLTGNNPFLDENKHLKNFFDWVSDSLTGATISKKPKFEPTAEDLYEVQNAMFRELKGVSDKKQRNRIIGKYQNMLVTKIVGEYQEGTREWYDAQIAALDKRDYDYPLKVQQLEEARLREVHGLGNVAIPQAMMEEWTRKLLEPITPPVNSSDYQDLLRQTGHPGCKPGEKMVQDPRTLRITCVVSNPYQWLVRKASDGWHWLTGQAKDANEVTKKKLDDGGDVLGGIWEAIKSPFEGLAHWLSGKPPKAEATANELLVEEAANPAPDYSTACRAGERRVFSNTGSVCVNKDGSLADRSLKSSIEEAGFKTQTSAQETVKTVSPPKEEKKEDGGILGWFSDVGKGIADFFGFGKKEEPKKPNCAAGMSPIRYGDVWTCQKNIEESTSIISHPNSIDTGTSSKQERLQIDTDYTLPTTYKNKPSCGPGFFAKKVGSIWKCARPMENPKSVYPNINIGEGDDLFRVNNCPKGTRQVVTNTPRKGDAICMRVKTEGAGIFIPSGNPYRPWVELSQCPPTMETVISHQPSPGDMTCRTPMSPRPAEAQREMRNNHGGFKK